MDYRTTNKEQVEELKQWWRQYGRWLLLAIIVGLLLGYGWRFWQSRQSGQRLQAQQTYAKVQAAVQQKNWSAVDKLRNGLLQEHPKNVYTSMVQLQWAQHAFSEKKYALSHSSLQWVQKNQRGTVLADLAKLQLVRLAMQQKQYPQALQLAKKVGHGLQPLAEQMQAVILESMGRTQQAVAKLHQAQHGFAAAGVSQPELEMQLASLPEGTITATAASKAAKRKTVAPLAIKGAPKAVKTAKPAATKANNTAAVNNDQQKKISTINAATPATAAN